MRNTAPSVTVEQSGTTRLQWAKRRSWPIACHNATTETMVGPGLAGVGDRAGSRVPGLSADAYIRQSLAGPGAYIVDGFGPAMPSFSWLESGEIDSLVAYLKTLN